jgi:hypothetical protein
MPSVTQRAHVPVKARLSETATRVSFSLPEGWSYSVEKVPDGTPPMDAQGRMPVRVTAKTRDDSFKLRISGAQLKLPLGVAYAAVYWTQFYGLTDVPEDETRWADCETLSGITSANGDAEQLIAVAWLQATEAVLEFWLEGPVTRRDHLEGVWALIRDTLNCSELAPPKKHPACDAHEPWWTRVAQLRAQGQLDEAIGVAERDGDRAEVLIVQADLHVQRMRRAQAAGQLDVARAAWKKAADCAYAFAASATSGSEGAARSMDRDRILAELGPEPT